MFIDRETGIYKWGDKILVSHLMLYNFYQFMDVLFLCYDFIWSWHSATWAYLQRPCQEHSQSWGCQPAQKMGRKLRLLGPLQVALGNQNVAQGEAFGGLFGRQHRYAFNFMSTSVISPFLNLALRVQQKICSKRKIEQCFNGLPLTHQRNPAHLLIMMKLKQNSGTNKTVYLWRRPCAVDSHLLMAGSPLYNAQPEIKEDLRPCLLLFLFLLKLHDFAKHLGEVCYGISRWL